MTIEEKAKRYDKALESMRDFITYVPVDDVARNYILSTFPELKENEDEKIKKEVLAFIRREGQHIDKYKWHKWIAWLEKQGGQKVPVNDFKAKDWYVSKVDGKIHNIYHSVDKVEPKFKVKYAGSEYNVLEVKNIAGVTYYGIEDEPNHIDYVLPDNCEIVGGYGIKENGFSVPTKPIIFSEQKPQRMVSAEAKEAMYDKPLDIEIPFGRDSELIEETISIPEGFYAVIEGNKVIFKKGKQMPAWSEDDKNRINRLIAYFEDKESFTAEDDVVYANWLKSLKDRYTWKPSDEQLNNILDVLSFDNCTPKRRELLESLYQDIKKLRDE